MDNDINQIIKQVIDEYSNSRGIHLMQENIDKMNKLLMGNGDIGLCEKVRKIEATIKPLWSLVVILGTAILGGLIGLFFAYFNK